MSAVAITFIHHQDGQPAERVQAAAPWEGVHYVLSNCPDPVSLRQSNNLVPNSHKFTVIRGQEMAWLCTNPAIPEMAAYVVREQLARGDKLEVYCTDNVADMRHYVKTGDIGPSGDPALIYRVRGV